MLQHNSKLSCCGPVYTLYCKRDLWGSFLVQSKGMTFNTLINIRVSNVTNVWSTDRILEHAFKCGVPRYLHIMITPHAFWIRYSSKCTCICKSQRTSPMASDSMCGVSSPLAPRDPTLQHQIHVTDFNTYCIHLFMYNDLNSIQVA